MARKHLLLNVKTGHNSQTERFKVIYVSNEAQPAQINLYNGKEKTGGDRKIASYDFVAPENNRTSFDHPEILRTELLPLQQRVISRELPPERFPHELDAKLKSYGWQKQI